jgi:hypothetical protein
VILGGRGMGGSADAGGSRPALAVRLPMRCMSSDACSATGLINGISNSVFEGEQSQPCYADASCPAGRRRTYGQQSLIDVVKPGAARIARGALSVHQTTVTVQPRRRRHSAA